MLEPAYRSGDVKIVRDTVAFKGFFRIRELELRHKLFSGEWSPSVRRELFDRDQAAGVLLYDAQQDAVVLTEQFRIGALDSDSPWLFELVAGIVEEGESAEDVAIREAEEEAGAVIQHLVPIHEYFPSPGGCNETTALFCAPVDSRNLGGIHGLQDEGEDIKVHVVPRETAIQAMNRGKVGNAATLIALQWLELNLQTLKDRPEFN